MEPGGHDAIMAFRVIFIFRQIGAANVIILAIVRQGIGKCRSRKKAKMIDGLEA